MHSSGTGRRIRTFIEGLRSSSHTLECCVARAHQPNPPHEVPSARPTATHALALTPVPGIVCERSTDMKSGTRTQDPRCRRDGSCGPSAKRGKQKRAGRAGRHAGRRGEAHRHGPASGSHAHLHGAISHYLGCLKHFHRLRVWQGKTEGLKISQSSLSDVKVKNNIVFAVAFTGHSRMLGCFRVAAGQAWLGHSCIGPWLAGDPAQGSPFSVPFFHL